jgi:hypothetical protein
MLSRRRLRNTDDSLGGTAAFFAEVLDEKAQAVVEIELFEKLLTASSVVDKGGGDEVGQHFGVVHFAQVTIDFFGQLAPALFQTAVKFEHFGGQRVGFDGQFGARIERLDARDGEGCFLLELAEFDPPDPLQNEVGSAVAPADAGADEADGADREKVRAAAPLLAFRPNESDAEHPVILQGAIEHVAKARLKNVERKERIRKEQDAREGHDGNGIGKFDGFGHRHGVLLSYIRAPGAPELAERGLTLDVRLAERHVGDGGTEAVESATGFGPEFPDPHRRDGESGAICFTNK